MLGGVKNLFYIISTAITLLHSIMVMADSSNHLPVSDFFRHSLTGWQEKTFVGQTHYQLVPKDDGFVLKAISQQAASGLFKEQKVDLKRYPYLNWSWRVVTPLPERNEQSKAGDDYAARIYLVISGGWLFWQTKALNYVWSSRQDSPAFWPNAYAPDNTRMIAVRSARDETGRWHHEKYNVYDAFKEWLGEEVRYVDAIAIMTDTDNGGGVAEAEYGEIYFSRE